MLLATARARRRYAGTNRATSPVKLVRSAGQEMLASHASPYTPGRLSLAAGELADADLIVMHCMGYNEAMRATVAEISGRPVLLARRMVAAAVQQLV